jgi:site-specific recombinase XerD
VKLRKALNLPEEMQLYSFRDTGMTDMIKNGMDPLSVKQLADHHSLEMTTIYTKHADPNLRNVLVAKTPKFTKKTPEGNG